MIRVDCQCGGWLEVPASFVGEPAPCPHCRSLLILASADRVDDDADVPEGDFSSRLIVRTGPHRVGEQILLGGRETISLGKQPGCEILLPGVLISRVHAFLFRNHDQGWQVQDNASRNGLYVNGRRVARHDLRDGDLIGAGEYALLYASSAPAAARLGGANAALTTARPPPPPRDDEGLIPVIEDSQDAPAQPPSSQSPAAASRDPFEAFEELEEFLPPGGAAARKAATEQGDDYGEYELADEPPAGPPMPALPVGPVMLPPGAPPPPPPPAAYPAPYGAPPPPAYAPPYAAPHAGAYAGPQVQYVGGQWYVDQNLPRPFCPSCERQLAPGAKICVECGIDVKSGRAILTTQDVDEETFYDRVHKVVWVVSWLPPWFGMYPVASEGFGTRKPYVVWAVAAATVFFSFIYFVSDWTHDERRSVFPPGSQLMLWPPQSMRGSYLDDVRGSGSEGVEFQVGEEEADAAAEGEAVEESLGRPGPALGAQLESDEDDEDGVTYDELQQAADEHSFGWYQLVTHAFLHGGIMHLAGNMLFLLVFGSRVNALIGQGWTAGLYLLFGVVAGWAQVVASSGGPPVPLLGASGAIMGLAGMYVVLFPANAVHVTVWIRLLFWLFMTMFTTRGFFIVLFYIVFDVAATVMQAEDGTAHWAHLGGFVAGVFVALVLLLCRQINARGGDLISIALGRRAWMLLGKPSRWNISAAPAPEPAPAAHAQ